MVNWREAVEAGRVLVADGAWGTELAKQGLAPGEPPELWNLERPDAVQRVAEAYVESGADVVLTNTFGGTRIKLARSGQAERAAQINRRGAELSRAAAGDRALVFASIGPTGEFLEPLGTLSVQEAVAAFAQQAAALADGGADGLVIETMMDLGEAKAALAGARQGAPDLTVVVCMSFNSGPAGFATIMGVKPEQAAEELDRAGADAVGTNCGSGIADLTEVARLMRQVTGRPLWVKPNAGLPELVDGETVYRETPEQMASHFAALIRAGANVIGGCCGTTPEHIRLLAAERDKAAK